MTGATSTLTILSRLPTDRTSRLASLWRTSRLYKPTSCTIRVPARTGSEPDDRRGRMKSGLGRSRELSGLINVHQIKSTVAVNSRHAVLAQWTVQAVKLACNWSLPDYGKDNAFVCLLILGGLLCLLSSGRLMTLSRSSARQIPLLQARHVSSKASLATSGQSPIPG